MPFALSPFATTPFCADLQDTPEQGISLDPIGITCLALAPSASGGVSLVAPLVTIVISPGAVGIYTEFMGVVSSTTVVVGVLEPTITQAALVAPPTVQVSTAHSAPVVSTHPSISVGAAAVSIQLFALTEPVLLDVPPAYVVITGASPDTTATMNVLVPLSQIIVQPSLPVVSVGSASLIPRSSISSYATQPSVLSGMVINATAAGILVGAVSCKISAGAGAVIDGSSIVVSVKAPAAPSGVCVYPDIAVTLITAEVAIANGGAGALSPTGLITLGVREPVISLGTASFPQSSGVNVGAHLPTVYTGITVDIPASYVSTATSEPLIPSGVVVRPARARIFITGKPLFVLKKPIGVDHPGVQIRTGQLLIISASVERDINPLTHSVDIISRTVSRMILPDTVRRIG